MIIVSIVSLISKNILWVSFGICWTEKQNDYMGNLAETS